MEWLIPPEYWRCNMIPLNHSLDWKSIIWIDTIHPYIHTSLFFHQYDIWTQVEKKSRKNSKCQNLSCSGAKVSAFRTIVEEVLLFCYDNSLLQNTFRNQWPHMTFQNFGPKKILSLGPGWPHKGKFRVKFFLLHFWNQNGSIREKKQKIFFSNFWP